MMFAKEDKHGGNCKIINMSDYIWPRQIDRMVHLVHNEK
jgi:hypothetical protein